MKVIFMGSPEFATPTLEALINSKHDVLAVYSQPARPSGRGQKINKTPVHNLAEKYNKNVFTPEKLTVADRDNILNLKPDLIIVVAYGLILPEFILNIVPCINLHPSALPKWRGAAPMNYPILNGENETDICIMKMEKGLDCGDVYLRKSYIIAENETAGELHDRFKLEGAKYMLEVVNNWQKYKDMAKPQVGETCYAHKFKTDELKSIRAINFNQPAVNIHNQIRGLSPWPGAIFNHNGNDIKVLKSLISTKTSKHKNVGVVIDIDNDGIHVNTIDGVICFSNLQRAGKKSMASVDFLKGYKLKIGDVI